MSPFSRLRAPIRWRAVAFLLIPIVLIGGGFLTYRLAYQNAYLHRQDAIDNCIAAARRSISFFMVPGQSGLTATDIAHIAATAEPSHARTVKSVVDEDAARILFDLKKTKDDVRVTWEVLGELTIPDVGDSTVLQHYSTFGCSIVVLDDGTVHGPQIAGIDQKSP
ncbi:hypothetical protein ACLQ3C_09205 [Gordonia sp. DT30]|uniref:hypothetical protein n=1 Tax=unclassified Gordonia (in: high G+C Gram-positive bacteria) TaxID=2657482 RepID=UPI003CF71293